MVASSIRTVHGIGTLPYPHGPDGGLSVSGSYNFDSSALGTDLYPFASAMTLTQLHALFYQAAEITVTIEYNSVASASGTFTIPGTTARERAGLDMGTAWLSDDDGSVSIEMFTIFSLLFFDPDQPIAHLDTDGFSTGYRPSFAVELFDNASGNNSLMWTADSSIWGDPIDTTFTNAGTFTSAPGNGVPSYSGTFDIHTADNTELDPPGSSVSSIEEFTVEVTDWF